MSSEKTAAEELAEAQKAFAAAQARLNAAQARVQNDEVAQAESPIEEASPSSEFYENGPFAAGAGDPRPFAGGAAAGAQATGMPNAHLGYENAVPYGAQNVAGGQQQYTQSFYGSKDHVAAGLLAILLGWLGLHKFYLGYNTQGFILLGVSILGGLFTFTLATWVVCIISIVEGIIYLSKNQTEFDQIYVQNHREWF